MSRLLSALPLLLLTGCLTVDPNAPQIPGLAWRIWSALIVGLAFGFWIGRAVEKLEHRFHLVRSLKPGTKVYADLRGMGIAGRLVSFDKGEGTALVDFGGCDGIQEVSLYSVSLYDET